jgi:hypothetical protein
LHPIAFIFNQIFSTHCFIFSKYTASSAFIYFKLLFDIFSEANAVDVCSRCLGCWQHFGAQVFVYFDLPPVCLP